MPHQSWPKRRTKAVKRGPTEYPLPEQRSSTPNKCLKAGDDRHVEHSSKVSQPKYSSQCRKRKAPIAIPPSPRFRHAMPLPAKTPAGVIDLCRDERDSSDNAPAFVSPDHDRSIAERNATDPANATAPSRPLLALKPSPSLRPGRTVPRDTLRDLPMAPQVFGGLPMEQGEAMPGTFARSHLPRSATRVECIDLT